MTPDQLDPRVRRALRSLSKANAEMTARHLIMAGRLIDADPELAYEHAQAAVRRAGRIDVVREAAAICAYATGRYAEALREVRTVRRLSGVDAHRPLEADSERGLGRPERALAIVAETDPMAVDKRQWVELQLVAAGARSDLGEYEAGLLALEDPIVRSAKTPAVLYRIDSVRADLLDFLGRHDEAAEARRRSPEPEEEDDVDVVVYDLVEESAGEVEDETVDSDPDASVAAPAERAEDTAPSDPDASEGASDAPGAPPAAERAASGQTEDDPDPTRPAPTTPEEDAT